jgi:hypothetical protein
MPHVQQMAQSHPNQAKLDQNGKLASSTLASLVGTLSNCAVICNQCADACLGEADIDGLRRCIRTDMDCAAICATTAAVLSRQTEPDWAIVRAQLQACVTACRACADECAKHADHHEHCRLCAETCASCADEWQQVLDGLPA